MDTNNPIEGLDIEENKDEQHDSNIDNFSKQLKNPQLFASVFDNQNEDLKNLFESFLGTLNKKQERALKKHIDDAQTADDIKGIIIENVYANQGYQIGNNVLLETVNNKQETARIEQETARIEQETVINEQETARIEQETVINEQERIEDRKGTEEIKSAIQARQSLIEVHPELATNTDENSELYKNTKNQLEQNGIIDQLQQSGYDEQFIDQYILVQTTLQELKANPTTYSPDEISRFDKIVKRLDNACNIPDTGLNSFSDRNIGNTRAELFNDDIGNKDLRDLRDNNMKSDEHNEYYNTVFGPENIDINALSDADYNNIYNSYRNFLPNDTNINIQSLTQEDKELLLKTKIKIDSQSKKLIEEMCIVSQIKGMYMCIGKGDNFELNKAREISNENGILTLNGHIDGADFTIRQDTKNEKSRLQTYSKLAQKDANTFTLGGAFKDSPFIMPSADQIFDTATGIDIKKIMEESNESNYETALQAAINSKMDTLYSDTKYVHHYMKNQILGEKITENTINILEKIKEGNVDGEIDNKNEDLLDFVKLISFNIDSATVQEKELLNNSLTKISEIIDNKGNNDIIKSKETQDYFNPDVIKNTKDSLDSSLGSDKKSILDFFTKVAINKHDGRINADGIHMLNFKELYYMLSNPTNESNYINISTNRDEIKRKEENYKFEEDFEQRFNEAYDS